MSRASCRNGRDSSRDLDASMTSRSDRDMERESLDCVIIRRWTTERRCCFNGGKAISSSPRTPVDDTMRMQSSSPIDGIIMDREDDMSSGAVLVSWLEHRDKSLLDVWLPP